MKKLLMILLVSVLTGMLTGCLHIEDYNGSDNYSITTITDEEILKGYNSHISIGMVRSSSYINGTLKGSYKVSKLSGVYKVNNFKENSMIVNFTIQFICEEGNAMLVIVSDDKIVKKIEANSDLSFDLPNDGNNYKLLVVGESAKITLNYSVMAFDAVDD